jgi:hypothetical protein
MSVVRLRETPGICVGWLALNSGGSICNAIAMGSKLRFQSSASFVESLIAEIFGNTPYLKLCSRLAVLWAQMEQI